jgi:hypothetical protein
LNRGIKAAVNKRGVIVNKQQIQFNCSGGWLIRQLISNTKKGMPKHPLELLLSIIPVVFPIKHSLTMAKEERSERNNDRNNKLFHNSNCFYLTFIYENLS